MELAAAAIQTITQAVAKVEEEVEYARSLRIQFRIMKERLELTRALLVDKGSVENKEAILKTALTQLREVIYEADDVLVDCLTRDEYLNNVSCSGCLLRYDPFFLSQTGKRLKEINEKIKDKFKTLTRVLALEPMVSSNRDKDDKGSSSQDRNIMYQDYNPEVVGLAEDLHKIKGWILDPRKKLHRIAIVGMGGLGKTTIAQKIFHDPDVFSRFKKLVWITVSQKFDEEKILRCLLEKLGGTVPSQNDTSSLMNTLHNKLIGSTCLIVMDNVWDINNVAWLSDLGSILSTTETSCTIITTRNQALPRDMGVEESRILKPKPLDEEQSWCFFSKFAFFSSKGKCSDPVFENLGRKIVKKCGGIPLAIKVVGSLLQSKSNNLPAWENVLETFFLDQPSGKENEVMASFTLSYNDLPPHLKQCFLCFSIYPEDFEIHVEQLIRWWIAEGLVQKKGSKTAMESGYQYVSELISRSLVEAVEHRYYDGRVYSCKLHDPVRELIMKIAEEERLCSFIGNGASYWFGLTDEHDQESLSKNLKLRALFVITPRCQVNFDGKIISLLSLRVLDFSGSGNLNEKRVKNILDWIGSLKRLACLNLSKAEGLLEIPSSICKLFNLQFLVLRDCTNLDKIHPSIKNLKKLIVLDLANCRLHDFPQGLGCLSNLQELSGFKVVIGPAENKGHGLGELRHLTHLRVLSIVISTTVNDAKLSKHEFNNLSDTLSALKSLEILAIDADKCRQEHIFETVERSLIPPRSLRELYLRKYYFATMPSWYGPEQLSSLQYLCIEDADIESLIPQVKNRTHESNWNVNLCLKSLIYLKARWGELQKIMQVQSLEVSQCSEENLKNFPCSVNEPGYWTRK